MSTKVREPRLDEAGAIAHLLNEHARSAFGETEIAEAEVRHWFGVAEIWIRVAERGGDATELDIRTTDCEVAKTLLAAGAVRLYERVGMHVARRNDTYETRLP